MSAAHRLVMGNWRLRHHEPVPPPMALLRITVLAPDAGIGARTAQMDCRQGLALVGQVDADGWRPQATPQPVQGHNIGVDSMPLALVEQTGATLRITHLLDRADRHAAHFIAPPRAMPPFPIGDLPARLGQAFEDNHLFTNNHECYYTTPAAQDGHRFFLNTANPDVLDLGASWLDHLASGAADGFVPQIGEELALESHDNVLCEVLANASGALGWVHAALLSHKRRADALDRLAQVRAETWDAQGRRQTVVLADEPLGPCVEEQLALRLELPLRPAWHWRTTRFATACESIATGHVFKLVFALEAGLDHPARTAVHCTVSYHKSRGTPGAQDIPQALSALAAQAQAFARAKGLNVSAPSGTGADALYRHLAGQAADFPFLKQGATT